MNKGNGKETAEGGAETVAETGGPGVGAGEELRVAEEAEGVKSLAARVRELLTTAELKIGKGDLKALGDYLKLVQMLKELEEREPREIRVRWVETIQKTET